MPGEFSPQRRAWLLVSLVIPCFGLCVRKYYRLGIVTLLIGAGLTLFTYLVGHFWGLGAGIFSGMLLLFPWWMFQAYQCSLVHPISLSHTWTLVWTYGHDIRFIGLLFGVAAFTDIAIIVKNPDYQLHVFCSRPEDLLGVLAKLQSPLFHFAIGYGFIRLLKWGLFIYLVYSGYGLLNATVNWICDGYGRIRTVFFVSLLVFTAYILFRRHCFDSDKPPLPIPGPKL